MSAVRNEARPVGDTAPPERWQHGDVPYVEHGRQKARDGVKALFHAGKIGLAEWMAADQWYRDYAVAVHGARDGNPDVVVHTAFAGRTMADAVIDAQTRYRGACQAVGQLGDALLRGFVGDQLSFRRLAERMGNFLDHKEIQGAVVLTLKRLAEFYSAT